VRRCECYGRGYLIETSPSRENTVAGTLNVLRGPQLEGQRDDPRYRGFETQGSIAQPQINLDQISHRSATIKYASHRDPVFIMQIGGVGLSHGEGLELNLSSQHPTQFRLYLIPED